MIRSLRPAAPALGLALLALPLLAGCGGGGGGRGSVLNQRPQAPCPRVALLAEAVDLTRYREGARPDLANMEVDARMTGFQARCDYASRAGGLDVTLRVQVAAERGPAATGNTAELPYLVAVTEEAESRVLNRGTDAVRVVFGTGDRRTTAQGEEMLVRIPGDARQAAEKVVLVGFLLSPEQLAANRRRGVR
ncbi:hypothetical protein EAH89_18985 [Roseomonas nepalensis]|uniref:Uncharacterized protein n=1 Tax=Muricoccus nepalensis TaxID=1854500 RepID=A0A502FSF4_9PROT|nr:hypothetical protein [Roseomonas nepalensis]TPG52320.1 hypothetical protein EAH89_18985 [Roseomonas nepalensis]